MEVVIVILIIVLSVVSKNNKAKKLKKKRADALKSAFMETLEELAPEEISRKPAAPPAPGAGPAQPKAVQPKAVQSKAEQPKAVQPRVAAPAPAVEKLPSGASLTDPEGCIGGSMRQHAHEGEPRSEHAQHMERASKAPAANAPARRIDREELRRAVVMAEILDRPKALRHSAGLRR